VKADARTKGRALEFAGVGAIVVVLALFAATLAEEALVRPLAQVQAALSGE
jgi:hypothetical protein